MKWIIVDFGTNSIKALRAFVDTNKIEILDWGEWKSQKDYFTGLGLPHSKAWAALNIGLDEKGWLDEEGFTLISALPSPYLETRYLKFPFRGDKKIEKVLPLELEATIPFDIEEVLVRHKSLEGEGIPDRRETLVLALAYKREYIMQFENELRRFQVALPPITTQNIALSTLRLGIHGEPIFAFLNIGHSKSEFILLQDNGTILGIRTLWWGGKNLAMSLSKQMGIDFETAQQVLKSKASLELTKSSNTESITIAGSLEDAVNDLVDEMRQTLKSFQLGGIAIPKPLSVYFFGAPTHCPGLPKYLEDIFRREFNLQFYPYPVQNLAEKTITGLEKLPNPEAALTTLAIALHQTRIGRRVPVFSESSFQLQQNIRKLKSGSVAVLKRAGMMLLAPLIFGIVHLAIQNQESSKVLAALSQALVPAQVTLDPNQSTDEMIEDLKKERAANRQKLSQLEEDQNSPLVVLTTLSREISPGLKIDIKELRINPRTIYISADVPSIEVEKQIIESLTQSFASVQPGKTETCTSDEGCKRINLQIRREEGEAP